MVVTPKNYTNLNEIVTILFQTRLPIIKDLANLKINVPQIRKEHYLRIELVVLSLIHI